MAHSDHNICIARLRALLNKQDREGNPSCIGPFLELRAKLSLELAGGQLGQHIVRQGLISLVGADKAKLRQAFLAVQRDLRQKRSTKFALTQSDLAGVNQPVNLHICHHIKEVFRKSPSQIAAVWGDFEMVENLWNGDQLSNRFP